MNDAGQVVGTFRQPRSSRLPPEMSASRSLASSLCHAAWSCPAATRRSIHSTGRVLPRAFGASLYWKILGAAPQPRRRLDADHTKAVGSSAERQRGIMGRHDQIGVQLIPPEEGSGEMDCIECAKDSRHWLRRSIEDDRIDVHQLKRRDQREDRLAARSDVRVGELDTEAKSIERTERLGHHEGARNTPVDLPPLRQRVRLAKRQPEQDRSVDVRDHRCA